MTVPYYGLPLSVLGGNQAVTVQSFTELNAKSGTQFEAADYIESSTIQDLIIYTGNDPMIIKAIILQFDGDGVAYQFHEGPTFNVANLGAQIDIYSLCKRCNNSSQVEIYQIADADITDGGTARTPLVRILGASQSGPNSIPTTGVEGLERILKPNTTYLLKREGLTGGQAAQQAAFYMTWYEGPVSSDQTIQEAEA